MSDLISRQAAIVALCKAGCDSGYCGASCDDVKAIENLPPAKPKSSESKRDLSDCISRQDAIDAAAVPPEWDGMYIQDLNGRIREAIEQLPSVQPETHEERTETHSCDCIERQAAISVIAKWMLEYGGEGEERERNALKQAAEEIKELPSAQPQLDTCPIYGGMCGYPSNLCYECPRHEGAKERPQWWTEGLQPFAQPQRIKSIWADGRCLRCGEHAPFHPMASAYYESNFCPNCGSDMRGEDDEAD